jgi:hypothetical protein
VVGDVGVAPTVLSLAGVTPPAIMGGKSTCMAKPLLSDPRSPSPGGGGGRERAGWPRSRLFSSDVPLVRYHARYHVRNHV